LLAKLSNNKIKAKPHFKDGKENSFSQLVADYITIKMLFDKFQDFISCTHVMRIS